MVLQLWPSLSSLPLFTVIAHCAMAKPFYRAASMDCWTEALNCKFFSCPFLIPHKCWLLRVICEPGPLRLTQGRSSLSGESLVAFMGGWWVSCCPRWSHRQWLHAGWAGGFSAVQGTLNADAHGVSSQERPCWGGREVAATGLHAAGLGGTEAAPGGGDPFPLLHSSECPGRWDNSSWRQKPLVWLSGDLA